MVDDSGNGVRKFSCDMCGLCCTFCNCHPDLACMDIGEGLCENLVEVGPGRYGCAIYAKRPGVCSTDHEYRTRWSVELVMDWEAYCNMGEAVCRELKGLHAGRAKKLIDEYRGGE